MSWKLINKWTQRKVSAIRTHREKKKVGREGARKTGQESELT